MKRDLLIRVVAVSEILETVWIQYYNYRMRKWVQKKMSFRTFMYFVYKHLRDYVTQYVYSPYISVADYFFSYNTAKETYIFKGVK